MKSLISYAYFWVVSIFSQNNIYVYMHSFDLSNDTVSVHLSHFGKTFTSP